MKKKDFYANVFILFPIMLLTMILSDMYHKYGQMNDAYLTDWKQMLGATFIFALLFTCGYLARHIKNH